MGRKAQKYSALTAVALFSAELCPRLPLDYAFAPPPQTTLPHPPPFLALPPNCSGPPCPEHCCPAHLDTYHAAPPLLLLLLSAAAAPPAGGGRRPAGGAPLVPEDVESAEGPH